MQKYQVELPEAIMMIGVDFDIASFEGNSDRFQNRRNMIRTYANKINLDLHVADVLHEEPEEREIKTYQLDYLDEFTSDQLLKTYFGHKYGLATPIMGRSIYDVKAVSKVSFVSNSGKNIEVVAEDGNPIFMYKGYNDFRSVRFYRPFAQENQIKHFGSIVKGDYFGKKFVLEYATIGKAEDTNIVFCAGQKDAMCVTAYFRGCIGVAMGSEGNKIPMNILTELYMLGYQHDNMYVLYDNDKTGKERSIKISKETGLQYISTGGFFHTIGATTGIELDNCKDVADMIESFVNYNQGGFQWSVDKDNFTKRMIEHAKHEALI